MLTFHLTVKASSKRRKKGEKPIWSEERGKSLNPGECRNGNTEKKEKETTE